MTLGSTELGSSAPTPWHRDRRVGIALIVTATCLTLLVGWLGPSIVTLTLGPAGGWLPPWNLPAAASAPGEWMVTTIAWAALLSGAVGLMISMRSLERGVAPRSAGVRLFVLGAGLSLATILVPPMTSADILMYASYGRLQVLGLSPYEISPAAALATTGDQVLSWTEPPWQDALSVYGPLSSWLQWLANYLGGESIHDIVFWLQLFSLLAFIGASAGVYLLSGADPTRQARAALLTVCNPLMIWSVLAAGHNEALAAMFGVGAWLLLRRSPVLAGVAVGLAGCAKLSIGLWGLALLWAYRRQPKKALLLCLGTSIPMGIAYLIWQPAALLTVIHNGSYVSSGSWAMPVYQLSLSGLGETSAKLLLGICSYVGLIVIAWMLSQLLPWPEFGLPEAGATGDPLAIAVRTAAVLSIAWLVTSMYTLSWYDLIAWLPLALLPASKMDRLLLARTVLLAGAFVPGRVIEISASVGIASSVVRDWLSPIVQIGVLVSIVVWWHRERQAGTGRDQLVASAK